MFRTLRIDSSAFLHKSSNELVLDRSVRKGKDLLIRLPYGLLNKKLKPVDPLERYQPSLPWMRDYQGAFMHHPLVKSSCGHMNLTGIVSFCTYYRPYYWS